MQQYENLAPHVNEITRALKSKMDPSAIEDELRRYLEYGVPLAQAKRDIVRMHGGTLNAGPKKVQDLLPEDRGVELVAKVLTVNPKEITVKGQPKQIFYGFVADETGKLSYTAWKDLNLQRGVVYKFKNAYAKKGFREGVELNLGDYSTAEVQPNVHLDVKDDFAGPTPSGEPAGRMGVEKAVSELRDGQGSVTLTARVLSAHEKVISTANGQRNLVEGELADESGRVTFTCWEPGALPPGFKPDAVVRVRNGYVRAFRGVPQLNFGNHAQIEVLSADALPDMASLQEAKLHPLAELEAAGGGAGVKVEGVVLEVKKGSGLIFRCGTEGCNRVLQKMECRVHGKQKGVADLRIKAVVDDGTGAATFFANREATEKVLGKTLAECQEQAREAMTVDVIQDELTEKLTARRVTLEGTATSDDYGLQINGTDLSFAPARDAEAEAEKLLGHLAEMTQEVGA